MSGSTAPGWVTTARMATSTATATTTRIAIESSVGPDGLRISSLTAPAVPVRVPRPGSRPRARDRPRPPRRASVAPARRSTPRRGCRGWCRARPPRPAPPRRAGSARPALSRAAGSVSGPFADHVGNTTTAVCTPRSAGPRSATIAANPSRFPASTNASRSRISSSSARDRTSASPSDPVTIRAPCPCARAANANEAAAEHARSSGVQVRAGIPGGVHHDRESPRLFLFELTDHDRAGARGGGPMHVAHAVAGPVLADPQVLGPLAATRRAVDRMVGRSGRFDERERPQRLDLGQHEGRTLHRHPSPALGDAERSGGLHADAVRPDDDRAAPRPAGW